MQENQMHYTQLSPYALKDLQQIAQALVRVGNPPTQLLKALAARSPILPRIALNSLRDAAPSVPGLSTYEKRLAHQLTEYLHGHLSGAPMAYARDRQAEAARAANSKQGYTSTRERVSLPDDLVTWWANLTPAERGQIVQRGHHEPDADT